MFVLSADPPKRWKRDEHEEIEHHEQVVSDDGSGDQTLIRPGCVRHGDQIDRAADIGADKHGKRWLGAVNANDIFQQHIGKNTARGCSQASQYENTEHPAALPPDLAKIRLKEKEGNGQRHQIGPDEIIGGRICRNNMQVGKSHGKNKTEYTGRDFGRPGEALLQSDRDSGDDNKNRKQHPCVIS